MDSKRIAVVGAGNMGAALLKGMMKAEWADRTTIMASSTNAGKLKRLEEELGIRTTPSNAEAAEWADVVILGVKPQKMRPVVREVAPHLQPGNLVVSIAAGITTETLEKHLGAPLAVVRAMPNVPVTVDMGATAICKGAHATEADARVARAIFERVGLVVDVEEGLMDAVTGLSGSGPMYVFQVIEGLADAGVKMGLSREVATALTVQTVLGAAKMVEATRMHPMRLKDQVTSPGGTAINALHSLERNGLRAVLMDAVEIATERAQELGRKANDDA